MQEDIEEFFKIVSSDSPDSIKIIFYACKNGSIVPFHPAAWQTICLLW